ncbi:RNA polymerase sigma factor SigJ [Tenggerimyces flavus]|uniref:RNA polymerase sigma factor SigJ n=1 Tax=Tenggerimyces flavus TaxID=1708749 RepID=A0ABV7YD55_9ACTN|nr:RNA polymerase sigma factor SigJ [Tenggerimyces flavus]
MEQQSELAERFEESRSQLRSVAYRMLGSLTEADDAVQEAWIRLSRSDTSDVDNLGGWLTTVVARVCLDMLRSRKARREQPYETFVPDPIVTLDDRTDPEQQALLADSVGLALLVVLETLPPAERLAFVLHDTFGLPFDEIAPIVDRTPTAARQLASRARRRVQGAHLPDPDLAKQREVVEAFLAAARAGEFEKLLEILDPDVVLRADFGAARVSTLVRGPQDVIAQARLYADSAQYTRHALINGAPGTVAIRKGRLTAVSSMTIVDGKIVQIDILADPDRLRQVQLSGL